MTAVELYNGLDGQIVSRGKLMAIYALAMEQGQVFIQRKIQSVLDQYQDEKFQVNITKSAIDQVPEDSLPGLEFAQPDDEFEGLEKAVSPDEIYQYITNLMINTIQEVGELPWQKEWESTSIYNGFQAMNWETKKGYRGINYFLLNFQVKIIEGKPTLAPAGFKNPYFLTFKQIEKHGGQLKKGSKGKRVVYFTKLYHYEEEQPDGTVLSFGSYNQKKFLAWIKKHQSQLQILKRKGWSVERLANTYIPILKYYNVFHADDITGIDWGDLPRNGNVEKTEKERIEIAEKIISHYPNPPEVFFKGDQPAYYPKLDQILMTPIEAFKSKEGFYSTFFHELIHSTGHSKRLDRGNDTRVRDNSPEDKKAYAFEELVAEMGAVFLCAESGILFSTKDNSAKYLKGWNKALVKHMEDDNRFFFRAASRSQAAADHILFRDKEGIPAYLKSLAKKVKNNGQTPGSGESEEKYPFSATDIPYEIAFEAHRGTSFSPEKRAKSEQQSYYNFLKETYDRLKKKAINAGRLEEFENNFPRFQDGYRKRFLKHLESRNGLMSTMITGASNFPVRKMEKKNEIIYKRLTELVEYGDKAESYILPFKSDAIKTGQDDSLAKLEKKLSKLQEAHELMKESNKLFRKYNNKKLGKDERYKILVKELVKIGWKPDNAQKVAREDKIPRFMLTNSNANIRRIRERILQEKKLRAMAEKGNEKFRFPGGEIEYNRKINKIQIHFNEKPSADTRQFLKKAGQAFKWSPKNHVWQRQLNTYFAPNKDELFKFLKVEDPKGLSAAWHAEGTIEREALDNCGRLEKGFKYGKGGKILRAGEEDNIVRKKPVKKVSTGKGKQLPKRKSQKITAANHEDFEKKYGISPKDAVKFLNRGIAVEFEGKEIDFYRELLIINHNEGLKLLKNKINIREDLSLELNENIKIKKAPVMRKTGEESLEIIAGRDPLRPIMSGIYVDDDAYVATDAHKMVIIKAKPPKNMIGKTINVNPRYSDTEEPFIEGKYPNYKGVVPNYDESQKSKWFDLQEVCNDVHSFIQLGNPVDGIKKLYLAENLAVNPNIFLPVLRVLKANGSEKVRFGAQRSNRAVMLYTDNENLGLVMPIFIEREMEGLNFLYKILDFEIGLAGAAPTDFFFDGLAAPLEIDPEVVHKQQPIDQASISKQAVLKPKGPALSLAESLSRPQYHQIFHVPGDIGQFLGKVEKKPVHSVVTTLDAEQGAGKTRFLFQVMDQLASTGLNCLFISLEEHPQSKLFLDKVRQYIKPENLNNILVIGEVENWKEVKASIEDADIIFIDSFQKLPPNLELDEDIRKAFNGKWFFVIYQQTGTKTMRGGSKAAFDGDIILKVHKDPEDFRNNYVYANKNRYNDAPDLKLNIFNGRIMGEKEPDSVGSSTSGKLVATLTI